MKQFYLRALVTLCLLLGSKHVEAQYSSTAFLSAGNDTTLGCNVTCFTLQSGLPDIKATTSYLIDSSLAYSGNYGFNITGATTIAAVDEIYSGAVTLPFTFCFYGSSYNQLTIGTNGAINFGNTNAYQQNSGLFTSAIPSTEYPDATFMAALQDLDITAGGSIHYTITGAAPNRKIIINYYQVPQQGCTSQTTTFQVVLYETTNVIELYIKDKPICTTQNGGASISGLQKDNTTALALPGKNNVNWGGTNLNKAYRFMPGGSSSLSSVRLKDISGTLLATVAASGSGGQLTASFSNVCLTANTETYIVSVTSYNCGGDSTILSDTMSASKLVIPLPVPSSPIYYCQGATSATAVSATGTSLKWYSTLTGGTGSTTAPTPSTSTTGTFKYYVSQTISGCESERDSVVVTVGTGGSGYVAFSNSPVCLNDTVLLRATNAPGASFVWTGPSSYLSYMQNPQMNSASYADSGTYTVTVTQPGCADYSDTTYVSINAGPSIGSVGLEHPTQCLGTDGKIKLGGLIPNTAYTVYLVQNNIALAPMTFTTNGVGLLEVTGLSAGFYNSITVSYLGCGSNEAGPQILNAVTAPAVTSTSTDPNGCGPMADGTITLSGLLPLGDYTINYEWNGVAQPPILISADNNGDLVIPDLEGGVYTNITATRLGCTTIPEGPISLAIPPTPVVTPTTNAPICGGDTIFLYGSSTISTVTWSWTGPNGYTSTTQNPVRLNATTSYSGMYYLTATNTTNYCVSEDSVVEVIVKPVPATPTATSNSPLCSGQTLNLSASGSGVGVTYNWSGPNSFTSTQQYPTISNVTTANAGNYGVYASKDGCSSVGTATVAVTVTQTPHIDSLQFTNPTTCTGTNGTISLFGLSASTTYTISFSKNSTPQTPQSITSNTSGVAIMTGLNAATYSNIVASVAGCSSNVVGPVTLTDPANPSTPTASSNSPLCTGQTLNLTASSSTTGVTYSWTGPNSFTSAQQNPSISNIQTTNAGTYSVVASINGCNSTAATTSVTVNQTPDTPVATSNSPICAGDTLIFTSTTVTGTYSWTGPNSFSSSLQNPVINGATTAATGNYIVNVSGNGCTSIPDTVVVIVNAVPAISGTTYTDPTTCLGTNGTITLTGLVSGSVYTVNYSKNGVAQTPMTITANGSGNVVMTGLSAGVYSGIYMVINACESNTASTITLADPAAPVITASNNTPICETDTIQLTTTTVTGATYSWSGPGSYTSSTQNPTILNATPTNNGTYTIIATVNNCSDTATTVVTVNATPTTPTASSNSPLCTGDTLNLAAGTVTGATYSWWGPNSFTSTQQNPSVNNVALVNAGTYYVTATISGCPSDTGSTVVVINLTPHIDSTTFTNPTACGGSQGTISLHGLTASTTFTVNYSKNGSAQSGSVTSNTSGVGTITGLTQGSYTTFTASANGCVSNAITGPVVLTDPAAPVITASNNTPICETDTVQLTATTITGATYAWSGPGSYSSGVQNPAILNATPTNNGTYTVIATVNNCSDTATTVVTVNATPTTPTAGSNSPVCSGDTLTLTAGNITGATYNWWGPNTFTSTQQNPSVNNVTSLNAGTYYVMATVSGCPSDTGSTVVVVNPTPHIDSVTHTDPTTCGGNEGTITLHGLSASSTYSVDYEKNGASQTSSVTTNGSGNGTITGLTAGTYTDFTASLNACVSNMIAGPIVLTDPAAPVITASNNTPICETDTVQLTATSVTGATYTWSGPGSYSSNTQNPTIPNATPADNGTYTVIATLNNCTDTATTLVTVNGTPSTPSASSNSPLCSGDTLNLAAGTITGATYSWWGPNTFTSTLQNPSVNNVTSANAGTYYVTAIVSGCASDTGSTAVVVNPTPHIDSVTHTDPTTCGGNDGTITLHGLTANTIFTADYEHNGTPQSQAITTNGSGNGTITGLSAGTYTDITASLNSCESNIAGPVTLVDPTAPAPPTAANNGPLCPGDTLLLTATATTGATYNWWGPNTFSSTSQNPVILNAQSVNAGTYYVTMTVANCTSDTASTIVVINPTPATPTAGSNSPVCSGNAINLTSTTVTGASYNWTGPNSFSSSLQNPSIANAQQVHAGDYILTVSINSCMSASDTVTVVVNETPVITDTAHTDPTMCGVNDGTITLLGLNNNVAYTVNYNYNGSAQSPLNITSTGSGDVVMTGLSAGVYGAVSVTVDGCTSDTVGTFTLMNPPPITVTAANNSPICEGDTIFLTATTITGATYTWTGPNGYNTTTQNPYITPTTVADSGYYTVTASVTGCTSIDSTFVTIIATPQPPTASSNSPVCEGSDINLAATTVNGATYNWSGPNSFTSNQQNPTINNAAMVHAGTYVVSVTGNGCLSGTDSVDVIINPTPVITDTSHTDPTTCLGTDGTITLEGLTSGYVYDVFYQLNNTSQGPTVISADGSGNVIIAGLGAGTYDSIYVSIGGCISNYVGPMTLVDPTAPATPDATNNSPICEGDTINLFANTVPGVTFNWTGPNSFSSTQQNPVILNGSTADAGAYILTVTLNNCTSNADTTIVVVDTIPQPPTVSSNSPVCEGEDINLTSTTMTGVTYNWSGPNSFTSNLQNPVINNAQQANAGTYVLSVTSTNGCASGNDSVDVVVNETPVIADTAHTDPTACMASDGTITLIGLDNNISYTVNYLQNGTPQTAVITSDGSGNVVITGLPAGTYDTITVMLNPCSSMMVGPIVLTDPGAPAMPIATNNTPICEGDTVFLFATTMTGVAYNWTGPNSYTSNQQNPVLPNATAADAGVYTVTASMNNCTSAGSSTTVVIDPTPTTPTPGSNSPLCAGDTLFLTATSVTGATYTWTGPNGFNSTSQNPVIPNTTSADSGYYTLTASIGTCGSGIDSILVVINPVPATPTAASNSPLCEGDTLFLTATTVTGATYHWTGPNGYSSNQQDPVITPVAVTDSGMYYVSVSAGGCTSGIDSIAVVVDSIPDAPIATGTTPLCEADTLYLTANTIIGATYSWTGPNGFNSSLQNPVVYNVTTADAGDYYVSVTTGGACASGSDTVTIVVNPAAVITGNSYTDPTVCMGTDGTITLNGFTPGDTYTITYMVNGGPVSVTLTADANGDLVITGLAAGSYSGLQVATTSGCQSAAIANIVLVDPNAPAPPVAGSNSPVCEGSPINLTASNVTGATYNWTGPNSYSSNSQDPVINPATPNDAGTYYVSVTVNGCTSGVDSVTVVVIPTATLPVITTNSPVCEGDAITFTVTSTTGATYYWWGPNGFTSTLPNPSIPIATQADAGTYYVTATINGCSSDTANALVVVNPAPDITGTAYTDPTICNGTDGTIAMTGLTPGTTYTVNYTWNSIPQTPVTLTADGSGNVTITGLSAGIYTGIGMVIGACDDTVASSITLTDPNAPATPVISNNGPLCEGDTLLLTSSLISGATYTWTGPGGFTSSAQDASILNVTAANAGTYTLVVSVNGCNSAAATTTVVINQTPTAPLGSSNSPLCEGSTLTLFATQVTGATYTWTGPNNFSDTAQNPVILNAQSVHSGTYYVNANFGNCGSVIVPVQVVITPIPAPPAVVSPVVYCENETATPLTATGQNLLWYTTSTGGTGSTTAPTPNTSVIGTTMYYVSQSVGVCESDRDSIEVIVNPKPVPPTVLTPINYCQGEPAAQLTAQGQGLLWYTTQTGGTGSTTAPTPNTNTIATYVYYVSQTINGCESDRAAITVNILPGAQMPTVGGPANYCQYGPALPAISSYVAGNNIVWYTQPVGGVGSTTAPVISTNTPGVFTYYVSQGNGACESNRVAVSAVVTAKPLPPVTTNAFYCQNSPSVAVTAQGQNLLWYAQQTGGTGSTVTPVPQTSVPGNTTYWVSQNVGGCESDRASLTVTVAPTPAAPLVTSPYNYCQNDPAVQLTPSGGSYLWYTVQSGGTGTATAPTPNTTMPGTFNWYVSQNVEGCESDRAVVTVNVYAKPQPPATMPANYCQGDVATPLTAQGQNLTWYSTHTGGSGTTATPTPITSTYGSITYYVSQTVNGCESDRSPLVVTVYQNVDADIKLSKKMVCRQDTATVRFTGTPVTGATYNWNFSGGTVVSGTGSGPYIVSWNIAGTKVIKVTVTNGTCVDSDSDTLTIIEAPDADFNLQDDACIGEEVRLQPGVDIMEQGEYHWNYGGAQVLSGSGPEIHTLKWKTAGLKVVSLVVTGQFCPSKPFIDTIKIHENPIAKIENQIHYNICSGDTVSLSAYYNTNYNYQWGPDIAFRGGGVSEGPVIGARIDKPMYVYVNVYDDYGCANTDSIWVNSQPCCNVWLPTAFTPNNDGKNDVYRLVGDGHIQLTTFAIRNRFGQVVFETANQYEAWDGKFNGQLCDIGTYFYYTRYKCGDKYVEKKGDVTLIR